MEKHTYFTKYSIYSGQSLLFCLCFFYYSVKQWVFAYCTCCIVISSLFTILAYFKPRLAKICICNYKSCKILYCQSISVASNSTCKSIYNIYQFTWDAAGATDVANVIGVVSASKNLFMMYSIYYKGMYLLKGLIINLQIR